MTVSSAACNVEINRGISGIDIVIETKRLTLHKTSVKDAALLLAVWNDPAFIRNVADRGIRTVAEAEAAIEDGAEKLFADYGYGPYCVSRKSDGAMIGICGLFRRDNLNDPDIGFAFLPAYCGQGYGYEAAEATIRYARNDLGLEQLIAIVSPTNAPSRGLLEKLGLRFDSMITMPGETSAVCLYRMSDTD